MPILNGFLRGVHDEEITANIDQKQYAGAPINMYNWIGTKRGGLSKRAPFKLQRTLDRESYIIPYSYDDDEKYLLQFYKNDDNETKYKVLRYTDGVLIDSTFGGVMYEQPTFSSNNSESHIITSQGLTTEQENAYKAFNKDSTVSASQTKTSLTIEFPKLVLLQTIAYQYGQISSNQSSGAFQTVKLEVIDQNGATIQIGTLNNTWLPNVFPVSGSSKLKKSETSINPQSIFAKKLKLTFSDYWWNRMGSSVNTNIGDIRLTGQVIEDKEEETAPFTYEQAKTATTYNSFRKLYFAHKDFTPYELALTFVQPTYSGLDFTKLGNPTLVRVFQQRLVLAAFTNYPRQINLSKSAEYNTFALNKTDTVSTDPIEGAIDEMKSPLTALFSGRQMLYAQSIDGLGSLNSGADDVPLTATQVSARLRNETPLSKHIQPIKQDEIIYCVGDDEKTVYALDYDYQYARVPLYALNEHCISYFDAGIKQIASMKGKLPYLVFLLNDGSLIVAISYRDNTGFQFHAFPQKIDGAIQNMAVLRNTNTGYDSLFAVVLHSNGQYTLESVESYNDIYTTEKGQDYFKTHVLLDAKQEIVSSYKNDVVLKYTGTIGENGKRRFIINGKIPTLQDSELKLLIDNKEIICKDCVVQKEEYTQWFAWTSNYNQTLYTDTEYPTKGEYPYYKTTQDTIEKDYLPINDVFEDRIVAYNEKEKLNDFYRDKSNDIIADSDFLWAITSEQPSESYSSGYTIPNKTFNLPEYIGLNVQAFDGEDFIEKESEDAIARTITFKKSIYSAEIGLPYTSYSEFTNIVDVQSAPYETTINNISACITYGTGIELGTESALEKIGYTEYPYTKWQDRILPDESLKNVILNDRGVKNKRIVLKCDFPFPANVTFITYDIKATGVR